MKQSDLDAYMNYLNNLKKSHIQKHFFTASKEYLALLQQREEEK